jgi:DNA polymerase family A
LDVHTITAGMMLGKSPESVNPKTERPVGKTMNFALLYGMGPKSLAERLGITMDRARELYAAYFAGFVSITTWMERAKSKGKARGYSETYFGRKYTVWELQDSRPAVYSKGERVLVNAPIQGGAADYMKIAMVRVAKRLKELGWWGTKCTITMNQHDSLTFEVSNELDPNEVRAIIEKEVVFPVKNFPKIVADWELGKSWGGSAKWKDGYRAHWNGVEWGLGPSDAPPQPQEAAGEVDEPEAVRTDVPAQSPVTLERGADDATDVGIRLIVELREMPTPESYARFLELMHATRGTNGVTLLTPEGVLEMEEATSLTVADQGKFAMVFSGCSVRQDASTVDAEALSAGMSF